MQATLATNAHKLVYSLDGEEPIAGDAVDVLLEAIASSRARSARGVRAARRWVAVRGTQGGKGGREAGC